MFANIWDLHLNGGLPEATGAEWGPAWPWLLLECLLEDPRGSLEIGPGRESQSPVGDGVDRAEGRQCSPLPGRESLPLPYLKQEELSNMPSTEPPGPTFQYVLCAATSPAVKQQEEALTYLNQGTPGLGRKGVSGAASSGGCAMVGWGGRLHLCPSEWGSHIPLISPRPVL